MRLFRCAVLGLIAAFVLAGCAWWQPPSARDAMLPAYEVTAPFHKEGAGQLMLTQEGMWAFVHGANADGDRALERGQLVGFLPPTHGEPAHLFAVVLVRSWGALLQRLDARTLASDKSTGTLVPLKNDAQLRRWGLCRGTGAHVGDAACLAKADPTLAWHLFRIDKRSRLAVTDQDAWGLTPPVHTDGIVQAGRAVVREKRLANGWVAVPVRTAHPGARHARVVLQKSCPPIDLSESLQPVEQVRADFELPAEPVSTEETAIKYGADALVSCSADTISVAVPTLFRPLLSAGAGAAYGVPYGAMRPLVVSSQDARARRAVILLGAALGTGSALSADFYLEDALEAAPEADQSVRLALDLMQVFAAAGRPEQGLRAGREAARDAWHLENKPAFVLGRGWVYAAIGKRDRYADSTSRLSDLAGLPENQDVRLWLAWNALRDSAAGRASHDGNGALDYFRKEELQDWLEATKALNGQKLEPGYERLARVRTSADDACANSKDCQLDVYGRNFAALLARTHSPADAERLVRQLTSTAVAAVRPGFTLNAVDAAKLSPTSAVAVDAALTPLLAPAERVDAFDRIVGQAAEAMRSDGRCLKIPGAQFIDARLAATSAGDDASATRAVRWLVASALPAACESPTRFADSLESALGPNRALAQRVAPLLEALTERAPKDEHLALLRRFADFTAKHERGAACKRWNLALAVSEASGERLDQAAKALAGDQLSGAQERRLRTEP